VKGVAQDMAQDVAQDMAQDVAQDVAQDLAFGARAARALLATPPPLPQPRLCIFSARGSLRWVRNKET